MQRIPPVAIGLPVYNGEKYLAESIESVLAQDFGDFDFLISDNCSTDSTWEICNYYKSIDRRVRIHRHQRNWGSGANGEFVFKNTESKYFMWHAHDDKRESNMLGVLLKFLDTNPDYVSCSPRLIAINDKGQPVKCINTSFLWDCDSPVERFLKCFTSYGQCHAIYGLIRRNNLERLLPFPRLELGGDIVMALALILQGKCGQINEGARLFRERVFIDPVEATIHYARTVFGQTKAYQAFPHSSFWKSLIMIILSSTSLSTTDKLWLARTVLTSAPCRGFIGRDLRHKIKMFLVMNPPLYYLVTSIRNSLRPFLNSLIRID
ncbi:MAG: glycosyltransferase [Desulfomonilaceae bacterium]|jgi:hypothetical protein